MDALEHAKSLRYYHTLELTPEYTTAGWFDLRPYVGEYRIPERLDGKRVLDVGTWDGFWAFELERRGAEVVALDLDDERDLDWPPRRRPKEYGSDRGAGFRAAREVLGSKVERVSCNIYDAKPENLGQFDLVFCGSVILHLRDQFLALERICGLTKPDGCFISAEEHDRLADLIPFPVSRYRADRPKATVFWLPSKKTWARMLYTVGFDRVEARNTFVMKVGTGDDAFKVPHVVHHCFPT